MIDIKLKKQLNKYIQENYEPVVERNKLERKRVFSKSSEPIDLVGSCSDMAMPAASMAFTVEKTFQNELFRLIDEKNISDPELYNKCFIDRKLFSKIRSDENYKPSKKTAILLCLGLELDLESSLDLLSKAGYTLSRSIKSDVIIRYFIENQNYNIRLINDTLYEYDEALLVNFV